MPGGGSLGGKFWFGTVDPKRLIDSVSVGAAVESASDRFPVPVDAADQGLANIQPTAVPAVSRIANDNT